MSKKMTHEKRLGVRSLNPVILDEMDKNEIVVVSRVRINAKIVELEISNNSTGEIEILKEAIHKLKKREEKANKPIHGAEMRVEDVIRVFPEYRTSQSRFFLIQF